MFQVFFLIAKTNKDWWSVRYVEPVLCVEGFFFSISLTVPGGFLSLQLLALEPTRIVNRPNLPFAAKLQIEV